MLFALLKGGNSQSVDYASVYLILVTWVNTLLVNMLKPRSTRLLSKLNKKFFGFQRNIHAIGNINDQMCTCVVNTKSYKPSTETYMQY